MTCRDDFSPKYRGIYDKAMTGKSPKSAIHAQCLICTGCKTKDIRDCSVTGCPLFLYRPYQSIPHKAHKPTFTQNLSRCATGEIVAESKKSARPIAKDIFIEKPPSEPYRLRITIEPKIEK